MARILIVEDDQGVRDLLGRVLGAKHYVVQTRNGREAIEAFDRNRPDLVITDQNLPGMKGDEIILELRSRSPEQKIIAMTGVDHAVPSVDSDVDEVFLKPMDLDALEEAVERLLAESAGERP
ncbi:MAG: response regulator [Candidatus Latescibacteria bacterium]|jgi:DNA-binding response OmpR family regulator|nr:response regulator [Candidatus Latescibacterota bacterium]